MAEMETERKSVLEYLSNNKFLIPMYQRPYAWTLEECEQLWNDIVDFFNDEDRKYEDEYFLGSVVMYKQNNRQNIIDGQQRTTSLSLLLKALYAKAFKDRSEETRNLVTMLERCLWDIDDISGKVDYNASHLQSDVIAKEDEDTLKQILTNKYKLEDNDDIETKIKKVKSNYEKNYLFFLLKSDEFAKENPTKWEKLCVVLLKSCILLPIECKGPDEDSRLENALRIFNTLNNRGIPLSDSDIFKGIIFKSKTSKERQEFAAKWKELESSKNMDFLFRNYMHVIRARNKIKTNEIGLRPFFTKEYVDILRDENTMLEIEQLSKFWNGEFYNFHNRKSWQFYEVLERLPNEYWKYLDSAYYMYCQDKKIKYFDKHDKFLAKVIANFLVKLINKPTIAEVKPIVFNTYTSLYAKGELDFQTDSKQILENERLFKEQFFNANKLIPALLTLNLYLKYPNQESCIKAEIEHIFPKTTQWRASYTGWDKEEAKPYIESIGNKMWLEKRLNIQASNSYFDDKKEKYKKSKFLEAQEFSKSAKNDWLKEDIESRNEEIYKRIRKFFEKNI